MQKKIVSVINQNSPFSQKPTIEEVLQGDVLLSRKEMKTFLSQFNLDTALDILWKQQEQFSGEFKYLFDSKKDRVFHRQRYTKIPFYIEFVPKRPAGTEPKRPFKHRMQTEQECNLCKGYRGGAKFYDLSERKQWKSTNHLRVCNVFLDNGKKFSAFINYMPYFDHHFVFAQGVSKGQKHEPWKVDVSSALKLSEKFESYLIAQNTPYGASIPLHNHFHVFQFPGELPIEKTRRSLLRSEKIGNNQLRIDKCEYLLPTYKFTIRHLEKGVDSKTIEFIEQLTQQFQQENPAHHYNIFVRHRGDQLELYVSLKEESVDKLNAIDENLYRPVSNYGLALGVLLVYTREERDEWVQNKWVDSKTNRTRYDRTETLLKYFSPSESAVQHFEDYIRTKSCL